MNAFLIAFSAALATADEMGEFIDAQPECGYWLSPFSNCILFTAELTVPELRRRIAEHFNKPRALYVVTPLDAEMTEGMLPNRAWSVVILPDEVNEVPELRQDPSPADIVERYSAKFNLKDVPDD